MNLRFPANLPSSPPLLLPLPWHRRSDPAPVDVSSLPSSPTPPTFRRDSFFDFASAIVSSIRSRIVGEKRKILDAPLPRRADLSGCTLQLFRPYVAKVPWHGGVRAFLSQLFPRYGHYCGPNWSSGKDRGLPLWDQRPIDWLDFCCYCHDIGYDTHDQAKLLQADLAFLECLERPRMATKGDARVAFLYKTMCIAGLRNILIPYRMQLVRMQTGPSFVEVMNGLIGRSSSCSQSFSKGKG